MKTPTRILTIEDFNPNGRSAKESQASLLRLKGCWLKEAGFPAGARVTIKTVNPGIIELRVCSPVQIDASYTTAIQKLDGVLNENPKSSGTTSSL